MSGMFGCIARQQMPDRQRQLRGRITGGEEDVKAFYAALRRFADQEGWDVSFEDGPTPFGDVGPLRKVTFGFSTRP